MHRPRTRRSHARTTHLCKPSVAHVHGNVASGRAHAAWSPISRLSSYLSSPRSSRLAGPASIAHATAAHGVQRGARTRVHVSTCLS
eukprot:2861344-Prymnesium_polylepis.1